MLQQKAADYATISDCKAALSPPFSVLALGKPQHFLYCSIVAPHPPYLSNATYMQMIDADAITLPTCKRKDITDSLLIFRRSHQ